MVMYLFSPIDNESVTERCGFLRQISNFTGLSEKRFQVYHNDGGLYLQYVKQSKPIHEVVFRSMLIATIVTPVIALLARIIYIYVNNIKGISDECCFHKTTFIKMKSVPEKHIDIIKQYNKKNNLEISISNWCPPPLKDLNSISSCSTLSLENGYFRLNVPKDGNCLFNSIALATALATNKIQTHQELRKSVIDHMETKLNAKQHIKSEGKSKSPYSEKENMLIQTINFSADDVMAKHGSSMSNPAFSYTNLMRTDGIWGGDAEISTFYVMNKHFNLYIWSSYISRLRTTQTTLKAREYINDGADKSAHLLFQVDGPGENHYSVILPVE